MLPPFVLNGRATHEGPDVFVEAAKFFLYFQEGLGVRHGGGDFQAVADDAGVGEKLARFLAAKTRHFYWIKSRVNYLVAGAFLQNGVPAQTCLRAFENQKFKPAV